MDCGFGRFSPTSNSSVCSVCPKGSFSNMTGQSACVSCGDGTSSKGDVSIDRTDCICKEGFYGDPNAAGCLSCNLDTNPGVSCPAGSEFAQVRPGYFQTSVNPPNALKCIPQEACSSTANGQTTCSAGYSGFGCGSCIEYRYYQRGGNCVPCPGNDVKILTFVGAAVVIAVIIFLLFFLGYNVPEDARIVLQTLQILSVFPQLSDSWPPSISGLFHFLSFTNFNIEFFSPECSLPLGFWGKYLVKALLPIVVAFGTLFFYFSWVFLRYWLVPKVLPQFFRGWNRHRAIERILTMFGTLVTATYTLTVSNSFSPFDCTKQPDGTFLMTKNSSVYCYEAEWRSYLGITVFFLIFYSFLVPGSIAVRFFMQRKDPDNPEFQSRFKSLVSPYRREFFYWELILMLKRSLFFIALQFLSSYSYSSKFFSVLIMLFVFFCVDIVIFPFSSQYLNVFSTLFNVVSMVVLISNGLIFGQTTVTDLQRRIFDVLIVLVITLSVSFAFVMNVLRRKKKQFAPLNITPSNLAGLTDEEKEVVLSLIFSTILNSGELIEVELRYLYQFLGVYRASTIVPKLFPELVDVNGRVVPPSTGLSPKAEAAIRRLLRIHEVRAKQENPPQVPLMGTLTAGGMQTLTGQDGGVLAMQSPGSSHSPKAYQQVVMTSALGPQSRDSKSEAFKQF
eukprot:TRINITY_DN25968_c0_g1_i3.p1 TRINITY_DN25968_c0_g1~~TRINITY_DN25968_c0_g1_i3.p1  ORF type:complete len:750 (+),score=136.20 TRINITY_DN25968_c0_g1_i3:230-2251(+)